MLSIINNSCFNQNIIKTCVRNKQMEVYIKRIQIRRYKRTNEILQNMLLLNPTQVVRNCLSRFFPHLTTHVRLMLFDKLITR